MPLVTSRELLACAQDMRFAVGAFNVDNMETVQAIVEAAEEEQAPVILQVSPPTIDYAGLDMIAAMVRVATAHTDVPVVLHLDHGNGFEQNLRALLEGFTSLMFDGSRLPYEENVAQTAKIVELAHIAGVAVEAELGRVLQMGATSEEVTRAMTDPDQALDFVERTGCDALAIAVGSVHAMKARAAELDIERVKGIHDRARVPLVLHGGSGILDSSLSAAIECGVCKVNVGTFLKQGFTMAMRAALVALPEETDFRRFLAPAKAAVKERARERMRFCGSSGHARDLRA